MKLHNRLGRRAVRAALALATCAGLVALPAAQASASTQITTAHYCDPITAAWPHYCSDSLTIGTSTAGPNDTTLVTFFQTMSYSITQRWGFISEYSASVQAFVTLTQGYESRFNWQHYSRQWLVGGQTCKVDFDYLAALGNVQFNNTKYVCTD